MSIEKAIELAKSSREKAHAPYSNFKVGSVVKFKNSETLFSGCNVENASFGGTICAERTAITKAISEIGKDQIEYVVVLTDTDPAASPCGLCRQVISEFSDDSTQIHLCNTKGLQQSMSFNQLFPNQFKL